MLDYYKSLINKSYQELRKALITGICYLIGDQNKEVQTTLSVGNEVLDDMTPVFFNGNMVSSIQTIITVTYKKDSLLQQKKFNLQNAPIEWLKTIYENLSGFSIEP